MAHATRLPGRDATRLPGRDATRLPQREPTVQLRTDPELRIRPQFKLPDWLSLASWSFGGLFSSFPTTVVFDALEGTRDDCVLRGQTRRRITQLGSPRPAAPPWAARPDPPVVCPGFGFDRLDKTNG